MFVIRIGAVLAMLLASGAAAAGERAAADMSCKAAGKTFAYDCRIALRGRSSAAPLDDARILVRAGMPSMPMAHNVPSATAAPAGKPGHYEVRLELEMYGDWTLTLDIEGPVRDRLVRKLRFGPAGAERLRGDRKTRHRDRMKTVSGY